MDFPYYIHKSRLNQIDPDFAEPGQAERRDRV